MEFNPGPATLYCESQLFCRDHHTKPLAPPLAVLFATAASDPFIAADGSYLRLANSSTASTIAIDTLPFNAFFLLAAPWPSTDTSTGAILLFSPSSSFYPATCFGRLPPPPPPNSCLRLIKRWPVSGLLAGTVITKQDEAVSNTASMRTLQGSPLT